MPKPGQTNAIREEDRLRYKAAYDRMKKANKEMTYQRLGDMVGLSKGEISKIFSGKSKQSTRKAALDKVLGASPTDAPVAQKLVKIVSELDETRQARLLERALALLDEQNRTRN